MTLKKASHEHVGRLMEQASAALVARQYFLCERLCVEAFEKSVSAGDYAAAARIVNPLQEARRQKRDLAWDSGMVRVISEPLGEHFKPEAGVYLLVPPRVGSEARSIRSAADLAEVPVIALAREPMTSGGRCPVVSVGPVTVRALVSEPLPPPPPPLPPAASSINGAGKGRKKAASAAASAAKHGGVGEGSGADLATSAVMVLSAPVVNAFGTFQVPSLGWMLAAGEALGDAAIAQVTATDPLLRVEQLSLRLAAHSDHEKLHQALREACERAAHLLLTNPAAAKQPRRGPALPDDPDEPEDFGEEGLDEPDAPKPGGPNLGGPPRRV